MVEMRSESDLWPQSISQAIHAWVKVETSNREGGVAFVKINGRDKKEEESMARFISQCGLAWMNTKASHCER